MPLSSKKGLVQPEIDLKIACPTLFLFTLYSQCLRAACLFQFRWILGNCLGTRDIRTYGLA
ncbi:hypothetical protein [uncultured Clostridium sp.]|uniref:hypothetical protein n=1 Tax=uncultured Clostridium sp. TaxID=59620 RepID=UPI0025E852E5|nr:hypothetical protein [uncultured Clostridium sp.]